MNDANETNYSDDELNRLLDEVCNETIDQEGHNRLQNILKASSDARVKYLANIDLHFDLRRLQSSAGDLPADTAKFLELINGPAAFLNTEARGQQVDVRKAGQVQAVRWRHAAVAAFAAALLFAVGFSWLLASKTRIEGKMASSDAIAQPLVQMTNAASAKFFGEVTPQPNSPMSMGHEYALTRGMIELHFPAGATTIIEAPAVFTVSSSNRLLLTVGTCSVYAPEGAQGFRVDTPLANVVDLGTRFVIDVGQSGNTSVQVVEGEADVFAKYTIAGKAGEVEKRINLHGHQASLLTPHDAAVANEIPYDESKYARRLPDRVIGFSAVEDSAGAVDELLSVVVQRDGTEYKYGVDELIPAEVMHYNGPGNAFVTVSAKVGIETYVDAATRARLTGLDHSLCSGIINAGGQVEPLEIDPVFSTDTASDTTVTPGLGIRFQQPVTNSAGPDIIVFELQNILHSERGDPFHVSPLKFEPGLHSYTIRNYDIDTSSPQSRFLSPFFLLRAKDDEKGIASLDEMLSTEYYPELHAVPAKILAVTIDLTDLGYAEGFNVDGLFFQDAWDDSNYFDPVHIAGLKPIP